MAAVHESDRIGGATGGILRKNFQLGITENIPGLSGKTLINFLLTPTSVSIEDVNEPDYHFEASASEHQLELDIRTKLSGSPDRHPDLYAAELLSESIRYFKRQGIRLTTLRGEWAPWSDNYIQYNAALSSFPSDTKEAQHAAARETWTGRQAQIHGFSEVLAVTTHPNPILEQVIVIFGKPRIKRFLVHVPNPRASLQRFQSQRRS